MPESSVLIAGCGDLGTEAGLRFAAAGRSVVGWRRRPDRLPRPIHGEAADLGGELPRVPKGTGVVLIAPAAPERTVEAYRRTYVDGVANVLDALERDGAKAERIVFVSSTAVYGVPDGSWVDEETPAVPASPTGAVMREAERLLHSRRPDATVLRLSGIYGPGRTRLIDQVRMGTARLPSGPHLTNRIHRDDAAAAIVHLATMDQDPAPLYVGSDCEPAHLDDVLVFLASELGLPAPLPAEDDGGTGGTDAARPRGGNRRLSSARLSATGFGFTYPTFRKGYRAVLHGHGVRHP